MPAAALPPHRGTAHFVPATVAPRHQLSANGRGRASLCVLEPGRVRIAIWRIRMNCNHQSPGETSQLEVRHVDEAVKALAAPFDGDVHLAGDRLDDLGHDVEPPGVGPVDRVGR